MEALNINQLKVSVEMTISDNEKFLNGDIRVIGLREKVVRRQETLKEVLSFLSNHSDIHNVRDNTLHTFLDYEVRSSWWASWINIEWVQELSGRYFAWKTSRKVARYKMSKMWEQRAKNFCNGVY